MHRNFVSVLLLIISVGLSAQTISTIRGGYNIRHRGLSLTAGDGSQWLFWDQTTGESYQMKAMKYDSGGNPLFPDPVTIPGKNGSHTIWDAQASSDGGVVLVYMADEGWGEHSAGIQKLDALAQPQWGSEGIIFSQSLWPRYPNLRMQANSLGGAYLLFKEESGEQSGRYQCRNFDAAGDNIWTEPDVLSYTGWMSIHQLILMDSGDLIINIYDGYGHYLWRVNSSGATVGDLPMFAPGSAVPVRPNFVNGSAHQYLIYMHDSNSGIFRAQLMNEDGSLVFASVKSFTIPSHFSQVYLQKVIPTSDAGYIACFKVNPEDIDMSDGLILLRLDNELNPVWGEQGVLVYEAAETIHSVDMISDSSMNTWLGMIKYDSTQQHMQIFASRIAPDGSIGFVAQGISLPQQYKNELRIASLAGGAMYSWLDYHADRISLTRQMMSPSGSEMLEGNGERVMSLIKGHAIPLEPIVLGDRSVILMQDIRNDYESHYYQVMDIAGTPLLEQDGVPLSPGADQSNTILSTKVTAQNTLGVLFIQYSSSTAALVYQEIDRDGKLLYPAPGVVISDPAPSSQRIILGTDNDSRYVYWDSVETNSTFYRKIMAQKIVQGICQWTEPKEIVNRVDERASPVDAQPGYLIFSSYDACHTNRILALHLDTELDVKPGWNPLGEMLVEGITSWQIRCAASALVYDDLITVIDFAGFEDYSIRVQKSSSGNPRAWSPNGILVAQSSNSYLYTIKANMDDPISLVFRDVTEGLYLQRIGVIMNGAFQVPGNGFLMFPGHADDYRQDFVVYNGNNISRYHVEDSLISHIYFNEYFEPLNQPSIPISKGINIKGALQLGRSLLLINRYVSDEYDYDNAYVTSVLATVITEPSTIPGPDIPEPDPLILRQNCPNPFKGYTTIEYETDKSMVNIEIYNLKGQRVRRATHNPNFSGQGSWTWDGEDENGSKCASGVYLYRVKAGTRTQSKKMLLLRE